MILAYFLLMLISNTNANPVFRYYKQVESSNPRLTLDRCTYYPNLCSENRRNISGCAMTLGQCSIQSLDKEYNNLEQLIIIPINRFSESLINLDWSEVKLDLLGVTYDQGKEIQRNFSPGYIFSDLQVEEINIKLEYWLPIVILLQSINAIGLLILLHYFYIKGWNIRRWLCIEIILSVMRIAYLVEPIPLRLGFQTYFTLVFIRDIIIILMFVEISFACSYILSIITNINRLLRLDPKDSIIKWNKVFILVVATLYIIQSLIQGLVEGSSVFELISVSLISLILIWLSCIYTIAGIELYQFSYKKFVSFMISAFGISITIFGFMLDNLISIYPPQLIGIKFIFVWFGLLMVSISNTLFFAM